jgi:hypothetical protein
VKVLEEKKEEDAKILKFSEYKWRDVFKNAYSFSQNAYNSYKNAYISLKNAYKKRCNLLNILW